MATNHLTVVYADDLATAELYGEYVLRLPDRWLAISKRSLLRARGYCAEFGRIFLIGNAEMGFEHRAAIYPVFRNPPPVYRLKEVLQ